MVSNVRWLLIPTLLMGWLGLTVVASAAVAPIIKDDGKFFSAEAVNKANDKIKKIAQDHNKDLLIETFPEIPADLKKDYTPDKKKEFFEKWARDRAHENAVNGVYILICKKPGYLKVEVGNETQKKAFTPRNRNELAKNLTDKFKKEKYDEGLLEAVDFYAKTLRENLGRAHGARAKASEEWPGHGRKMASAAPASANRGGNPIMGWICIGVVVLLALWLVFALIRAFTGAGRGGSGGYGGGGYGGSGGGGGGFFSSLLGGMFGAAAGMWMYDHFFHSGSSMGDAGAAHAAAPPVSSDMGTGEDTDYSGSGGEFGDEDGGDDGA
ncbi:MAG: TPM domain-containing protein, partial [Gemmataceae bacterium]